MIKLLIFSTSMLTILLYPLPSFSTLLEGIVLSDQGPVKDSAVYAYSDYDDIKRGAPTYISAPGEKEGFYKLELPPGKYYLMARGSLNGSEYYAYHGANPISIESRNLWIPFMTVSGTVEVIKDATDQVLTGKVIFNGIPVEGAQVSIYTKSVAAFRGMGYLTSTTDSKGMFTMSPEPGEYVIVARKRMNFSGLRPLEKGDLYCFYEGNPLSVKASKAVQIEIPCYPKDDLKAFLDEKVYPIVLVKKSGDGSVRFRENKIESVSGVMTIKGRVTDLKGNPKRGVYVMAYKGKPSRMFQMLYVRTMPEALVKTDEEGYYTINETEPGEYYLLARELIGEAPAKGENYGLYEGNTNHSVTLSKASVTGADIVVSRVMAEDGTAAGAVPGSQTNVYRNKAVKISNYEYGSDAIINDDTTWAGYIIISGTVHVARTASLIIEPGTVVLFRKVDGNSDGVGDGKIRVSGRLVARGTPDDMIRFSSAEDRPGKMDWSYLLLFVSGEENIIKHCIFEYAFTGVQVHFSRAEIEDSVFTNNHEGIRFGRTELQIEHNDIRGNSYGIRYTRLEGPVEIKFNKISGNNVGIFHVPSNQNIVDFSDTFTKKEMFHRHQPVIRNNNISHNDEYNFRLGERQGYNMNLRNNWWGRTRDGEIIDYIYDERTDETLGKIIFKPYYTAPVKTAGIRRGGRNVK